jgi:hypothetical protein
LIVTAAQLSRLDAKLGVLAAAIDEDGQPVAVVVFRSETRDFALQRHRELRPDHAGRPVRFEHRNGPHTEVTEMFAVHTPGELKAVLDRIEAKGRGKPIGEQVLADVHGRGEERPSQPSRLIRASDPSRRHSGMYLGALPVCSGNRHSADDEIDPLRTKLHAGYMRGSVATGTLRQRCVPLRRRGD